MIVTHAALAQMNLQTVGKEFEQFALNDFRLMPALQRGYETRYSFVIAPIRPHQGFAQRQTQAVFKHETDDTEGGTAQCEGIARTGGLFVYSEKPDQRVELVGEGHGDRGRRGRAVVIRPGGGIVFGNRTRDSGVFAVIQRIVLPHSALQFGEFIDHLGHQVGLGEMGSPHCLVGVAARNVGCQFARQRGDTLHLLRHGAKVGVKYAVGKLRHTVFELLFAVLIPKELGVRQARAQDTLVAGNDRDTIILGFGVRDNDKTRRQTAIRIQQRKIFLV